MSIRWGYEIRNDQEVHLCTRLSSESGCGMVSEVYSNDPNTDVIIVDEDSDETTGRLEIQFPEHRVY